MFLRKISAAVFVVALSSAAIAVPSVNPAVPSANSPLASAPIRNNFQAVYNDLYNILTKFTGSITPFQPTVNQEWMSTAASPWTHSIYDGSQWVTMGTLDPSGHVYTPVSGGAPGGPAGGDLGGTYPNPTVLSFSHIITPQKINLNAASLQAAQNGTVLQLGNVNGTSTRIELDAFAGAGYFSGVRADGTAASPTALQAGEEITGLNSWGYNGSAFVGPRAGYRCYTDQIWTTGANGTYCDIVTTPDGMTAEVEIVKFGNDGGVVFGSSGTDEGAGTLNLTGGSLYNNGTAPTGTGAYVRATSPSLVTPALGVATATSLNGNTFTTGTYTLTGSAGKTLTFSKNLTLTGTDGTTETFPASSATIAGLAIAETWSALQTFTNSDLALLGSSTGKTTFASANAGSTSYTQTFPAYTGNVMVTNTTSPAQGDVAYFDGTHWTDLAPGTSGNLLQSGGPAANPSWVSAGGGNALFGTPTGNTTNDPVCMSNTTVGVKDCGYVPSFLTNSLSGNVALGTQNVYFTGPTVAQGGTGTWCATGTVTVEDSSVTAATFSAKLWDGTTVISSASFIDPVVTGPSTVSLSGCITSPAGNIRISVLNASGTTGAILYNASGNSADSTLTVTRLK